MARKILNPGYCPYIMGDLSRTVNTSMTTLKKFTQDILARPEMGIPDLKDTRAAQAIPVLEA